MKLTSIKRKLSNLIPSKCFEKIDTSFDILWKISDEIKTPNTDSIQRMQIRTLDNLQNEIN